MNKHREDFTEDDGRGAARMLGWVIIATVIFWSVVAIWFFAF